MKLVNKLPEGLMRTEPRVGKDNVVFRMHKINVGAGRVAIDELGQLFDIRGGNMQIFGWRPLAPPEHEEFMDCMDSSLKPDYEQFVLTTLPGIFSTFAVRYHTGHSLADDEFNTRARMNLEDARNRSLRYKSGIILAGIV